MLGRKFTVLLAPLVPVFGTQVTVCWADGLMPTGQDGKLVRRRFEPANM